MERINRKRLVIIILLLIVVVVELIVIGLSKASKTISITMTASDYSSTLSNVEYQIEAIDDGAGYYITLPETINSNVVTKYYITRTTSNTSTSNQTNTSNTNTPNSENSTSTNDINNTTNIITTIEEKSAGDTIFLTQDEITSKAISVSADYDKKTTNNVVLYKKILSQEINTVTLNIKGYMPLDSTINLNDITSKNADIENTAKLTIDASYSLLDAYSFSVFSNNAQYNPQTYNETMQITFNNLSTNMQNIPTTVTEANGTYTITKMTDAVVDPGVVTVNTASFGTTYAIFQLPSNANAPRILKMVVANGTASTSVWDGTAATGFAFGDGSSTNPYLITTAQELAYLASQVNGGNHYDGKYFELTTNIDLDGKEWTPIGTSTNYFGGIFDGSGRIIKNGIITVTTLPTNQMLAYGIFGSMQGGTNYAEVKNTVFDGINITISSSGTTTTNTSYNKGYYVGTVVGVMYQKSRVKNVIAKNGTINTTNTIRLRNASFIIAVGGIAGYAKPTAASNTDPGAGSRYDIEYCYSETTIDISSVEAYTSWWASNNALNYLGQCQAGGIIGTIRSEPQWPTNCLYKGSIATNSFAGPVFGGLIFTSTTIRTANNTNTFSSVWNGNEGSTGMTCSSYYSDYSVNGTTFGEGTSVTSGISTQYISSTVSIDSLEGIEGVNKGIYASDISTMVANFNAGADNVNWQYTSNDLTLIPRLYVVSVEQTSTVNQYQAGITDKYNVGTYVYTWYINGTQMQTGSNDTYSVAPSFTQDQTVTVEVSDGTYHGTNTFVVPKLEIHIVFNVNNANKSVTATLAGTALSYITPSDYTYQWYSTDIAGLDETTIDGATSTTLTNLEEGMEYKLIATNNNISQLSATNSFVFGDRIAIFVDYQNGSNYNDGFTPATAVRTMSTAYGKLSSSGTVNTNVIIIIGNYTTDTSYINTSSSNTYSKNVTITGTYKGTNYAAVLAFEGTDNYRYLNGNTSFQYLTFNGQTSGYYGGGSDSEVYFFLQGYSLTMGNGLSMTHYRTANTNQGLITGNAPAFHIIAGWLQYDYSELPRNNPVITIKSGTYGRIILGSSPGYSSASTLEMYTSRNFTGSSTTPFNITVNVDIKTSTTASTYVYDINLLVGGCACGNNYSNVTENIISGKVGRVLGGSIGDSSNRPDSWDYPINTYLGSSTINISGGSVNELYGGDLGRNMSAIGGSTYGALTCDSYYYGTININISGGTVTKNIYGAGAGGVTGYNANSSDSYKSYGLSYNTSVNINISGGTISGDIYGGGYGYTEYLTEAVTAADGGSLYGNSNITISGSPSIAGNVYGGSCGYDLSSKPNLAQMVGTSSIVISGTPNIVGEIYGASKGISGYTEMAKLTGTSNITLQANLSTSVFGGGNIAKTVGNTNLYLKSGTYTADIYGGGNLGNVEGSTNVHVQGGHASNVYCGGKSSDATTTFGFIESGSATNFYGGSNITGAVQASDITASGGTVGTIFGGNNAGGTCTTTLVKINGTSIGTAVYGGGNQVATDTTEVHVNSSSSTIPEVYGGGNQGTVINTTVYVAGANSTDIYGGGNQAETTTTNIFATAGTVANLYGGGHSAGATKTNVNCSGANITNAFGGSNSSGTVDDSNINITAGKVTTMYGGNNAGGTSTVTHVNVNGGAATTVFGGGNQAATPTSNVLLTSGAVGEAYGGGNQAAVTTTNITENGTTANKIFGGGSRAGATTTNVYLNKGKVGSAFGGSNNSGDVTNGNVSTSNVTTNTSGLSMTVTADVSKDIWRNVPGYPTYAYITVKYTNNSSATINTWNSYIDAPNSKLYENDSSSEIIENNGEYTLTQVNRWYGTNTIPAGGTYSFNFHIVSAVSVDDFTIGYGIVGTGADGNTYQNSTSGDLNAKNVYGGNNAGGTSSNPIVTIGGGNIENVFGGGNEVAVTKTNVNIQNGNIGNVFGGGNAAGVDQNTLVAITGGTINVNAYGGGNDGTVTGNTVITMNGGTITGSIYGGGNGSTAVVNGNTNLTIEGTSIIGSTSSTPPTSGCAFGGGNAAATGSATANSSTSNLNIVGGTIHGNVYGGANTSVVYGTANVDVGYDAVADTTLTRGDVDITGTLFGGGEANASGSEVYDFSFISVTKGINININGNGYTNFKIEGSIFGSGDASSASGTSIINIKNYGTVAVPKKNVSIQRANTVTFDSSAVALDGAKDRTNEYSNVFFSLSRIDLLKLKNNSTLYLNYGANLVKGFSSLVDVNGTETKATATIADDGTTTRNVDNRLYMYEGKNFNIATNEQTTAYGDVNGMTFLGMFTNTFNPATSTGLYNYEYTNGSTITNAGTFSSNAYVLGAHKTNHDIKVDGFYTTKNNDGIAKEEYVGVTPESDIYYIWLVGEKLDVTTFEVSLTASKYATLGTYELSLTGFSTANSKYVMSGFSAGLRDGISLVDKSAIPSIASPNTLANTNFGLSMKSGKTGWQTNNETDFYTSNGGEYTGSTIYKAENLSVTPTLEFCFYHSQNLSVAQTLGTTKIRFQVLTPVDDLTYSISYIDINITLSTALYQDDYFEQAISPGEEFSLFTSTETQITNDGIFSIFDSLYIPDFTTNRHYAAYTTDKRCIVSRDSSNNAYVYKANTKITMLDLITNTTYYYVVTSNDETSGKYKYYLADFTKMGSTNEPYDETDALNKYYDSTQNLLYEKYIFHIDFGEANVTATAQNNSLLMELQSSDNQTLIGVLGIERDTNKYSIFTDKSAVIKVTATTSKSTIYLKDSFNLNVSTEFKQSIVNSKTIYDTKYFNDQMGIKISWFDSNGNQLNSDSLLGINLTLNGETYYPRIDGTTRINIAEKVSNVLSKITIDTSENTTLATGTYKIKVESFGSPDGIYYGLTASDSVEKEIYIINGSYGLKVITDDNSKIIKKSTGFTLNGNNSLTTTLKYSSALANPKISVSIERRDYTSIYAQSYTKVDFQDYVTNTLTAFQDKEKEYVLTNNPSDGQIFFFYMKPNCTTGTYKLVFKLYDGTNYIGQAYEYFIIN